MPPNAPRPLPFADTDTKAFWDACKRRELLLQRNRVNGQYRYPPVPEINIPGYQEWEWVKSGGKGKVYTFCIPHHPAHPYFRDKVPYNVVLVELEEGVRITANLVGIPNAQIKIGMPVVVDFEDASPDVTIPFFKPA